MNYFSFGIDGKVGYSFDKHRANSRVGNLIVYGALGVIKGGSKTKSIDELVESCWIGPEEQGTCMFKSGLKSGNKGEQEQI